MQTCDCCASSYHPLSVAWGQTCGECLAMRIELALLGAAPGEARKPPKRASPQATPFEETVEKRSAA